MRKTIHIVAVEYEVTNMAKLQRVEQA